MTARDLALHELDRRRLPGWPPEPLLRPRPQRLDDPRDAALADQLLFGIIQNLLLLQHLVAHYSGRSLKSIDPLVQKILVVGLYQLRFLQRIPPSAAVNEAVNQAKRFGRTKAAGFINAVLRKATRELPPPLPDRQSDPAAYAERALSHPRELFTRLAALLGPEAALSFCEHDNREPPLIVRLSPGITPGQLESPGLMLRPHEQPNLFVVEGAKRLHLAEWSRRGLAQAQDPTAAAVVPEACPVEPGQRVLDRCAGLGTKTMQLLQRAGPTGHVVAMDPNADRCRRLRDLLAERNIPNVTIYESDALAKVPALIDSLFDLVLIDAPCSNSGVLPRRPEARYAQSASALRSLEKLQIGILTDTAPHVRPGGFLVYSTCSVWSDENQSQVQSFLEADFHFTLLHEQSMLPSMIPDPTHYHDGGYRATLRRAP
jgi:16S rRNA (cytosine967-C5)-methyltransferase